METQALFQFLERLGIRYEYHAHVAVYTSEQARRLLPPLPGAAARNLFLRDRSGRRHFLLVLEDTRVLDLKSLAADLGVSKLSLASAERLRHFLGVEPGAVSLLALVNDPQHQVEVLIDQDLWQAEALHCHPLVNTATLIIPLAEVQRFLAATGHVAKRVEIKPGV